MKLAPFASGLAIAGLLAVAPNSVAHAQSPNHDNTKKDHVITVVEGDTLDGIAKANDTTYIRLFDANDNIKDPDMIFPGDKIRIPDADEQLTDRQVPDNAPAPQVSLPSYLPKSSPRAVSSGSPLTVSALPKSGGSVSGCGDNSYAHFIYMHESGCRTTASSPNGCYGIGQACPASKIAYCGADYSCQDAFFSRYASKYGGWAGAYSFWTSHGWW